MELAMTNGFSELSFNEMELVDGGNPLVGIGIGIGAGWIVDGILQATTGKSGADYVSDFLKGEADLITRRIPDAAKSSAESVKYFFNPSRFFDPRFN